MLRSSIDGGKGKGEVIKEAITRNAKSIKRRVTCNKVSMS